MRAYARDLGHRAWKDQSQGIRRSAAITIAVLLLMGVFAGAAQAAITNVAADNSSVSQAAGARTVYKVGFTSGVKLTTADHITITFPNGTDVTKIFSFNIVDTTTGLQVGNFCSHTALGVNPPVLTCSIFNASTVNAGDAVAITLDEVVNPGTTLSNPTVTVSTSEPGVQSVVSASYQVVAQNSLTNVTAANSQVSQAIGARTVYTIGFKTSSTGGLSGAAGSQFTITFPNGTDVTKIFSFNIVDTTTGLQVGNFCSHTALGVNPPVLTCNIFNASVVNPGDVVTTTLDEVVNPPTTAANPTVSVATTSDTTAVSSPSAGNSANYQIVTAQQIITPTVSLSNQAPSAAGVGYTIGFTTSSTGGLSGAAGSQITITLANGTDVTHILSVAIRDTTTGLQVGNFCAHTAAGVNPPVLTCNIFNASTVGASHGVSVAASGITNPSTAATEVASVSTTSDPQPVNSNYSIGGNPPAPTITSISPPSGPAAGGTAVTIDGANFTGATVRFGSAPATVTSNIGTQMVATAPPGTGTVDVIVTNAGGISATSASDRFTYISPPPPPASTPPTVAPSSPSPQSGTAAVSGTVNPHGLATTVVFQYGLDPSLRGPGSSTLLYDQSTTPQQVGAGSTNQPVTASLTGLLPGALYHVRMVATNSAGTTNGPDQTFTTAAAAKLPPPVLGQTQNARPVSGKTFILVNGKFVPLTGATKIPSGATIDALHGTLALTSATGVGKKLQTGTFGGAVFKVVQARAGAAKGLTTLSLVNNAFKGAPSFASCTTKHAGRASAAALSAKTLQLLKGRDNHGKFRTKGRYAAATTRGTVWSIADRCDGTLTQVNAGTVVVSDFVRHRSVTVRAHHSYLAKARK
jgi:IPT/TIG domain